MHILQYAWIRYILYVYTHIYIEFQFQLCFCLGEGCLFKLPTSPGTGVQVSGVQVHILELHVQVEGLVVPRAVATAPILLLAPHVVEHV